MKRNISVAGLFRGVTAGAFLLLPFSTAVLASSHREAPLIANDPLADNTDVYAFRSPNNPNTITIIANYIPMQLPHGGPNYYFFGENVRYEIHIDNNAATLGDDIIYRFTFTRFNEDPSTFFRTRLGKENNRNRYTLQRSVNGGASFVTIIANGIVPPPNVGPRSIQSAVGLGASSYSALMGSSIMTATSGERVFAGPVDDPFFVDLGGIFDLGNAPRQGGTPRDGLACKNVHSIAIQVPISTLQKSGKTVAQAANILDSDFVIGVWASASRQQMRTLPGNGTESFSGPWVQVSRLGMPLTNEVVIPVGAKDEYNRRTPYNELAAHNEYFYNPELALYMDPSFFASSVPAFGPLRIQKNSLGAFGFGNTQNGLFALKGTAAVAGTALGHPDFEDLLLPGPGKPRSVDLWPIFHTGVPNLRPYQLATGKPVGDPLAAGKPFINNFLPTGGDMLRLNMAVPVTQRTDPAFSTLGLVHAAVLGLTTAPYNTNANLEFIPNMDGFPNGRRLEDDVTRIELQAVAGVVLAAIGLPYDDYTGGPGYPLSQDLLDVLGYSTGVEQNDTTFMTAFPYMQAPWSGTGGCSGQPVAYNQPPILPPSAAPCLTGTYTINPALATGGTNFQSLAEAGRALNGVGICGPVTLNVDANAAADTAQLRIGQIPGSSTTNTVTLNGNGRTLTFAPTDPAKRYIVLLDGTDNFTLNNFTIATAAGAAYGWGVQVKGSADNVVLSNLSINVSATSTDANSFAGIALTSSNTLLAQGGNAATNLQLLDNVIDGGYFGISLIGNGMNTGFAVAGNTITNAAEIGIRLTALNAPVIERNTITLRTGRPTSQGLRLESSTGAFSVRRNRIVNPGYLGMGFFGANSTAARPNVLNNMIGGGFQNAAGQTYGVVMHNTLNVNFLYNSVLVDAGAGGRGFSAAAGPTTGLDIRNNSFAYTGTSTATSAGLAIALNASGIIALDYNNYYSTTGFIANYGGANRDSLNALQAVAAGPAGHDLHSKEGNPMYISAANLHVQPGSTQLANSALVIAAVSTDIDGDLRGSSPDIGADEYTEGAARLMAPGTTSGSLSVTAYPNPFRNQITLQLNAAEAGQVQVHMVDMTGRTIARRSYKAEAGTQQLQLTLAEELPQGLYMVSVRQGSTVAYLKLLKE